MTALLIGVAGVLLLTHVLPFPFLLEAFHGRAALWEGPGNAVYLTFDDGVSVELLDMLRVRRVKATFFLTADRVTAETAPLVKRMFADGHCIGQRAGQRWLLVRSPDHVAQYLEAGARKVEMHTGQRPARLFRPHGGWRSGVLYRGVKQAGYRLVGWSWGSTDWTGLEPRTGSNVAAQVLEQMEPGQIIVLHEGTHRMDAVRRIIDGAQLPFATLCAI